MVSALTSSGDGVQLVNAKAGAGKTFAPRAARLAWEAAGYRVVGALLSRLAGKQRRGRAQRADLAQPTWPSRPGPADLAQPTW
jgi:AAA domain